MDKDSVQFFIPMLPISSNKAYTVVPARRTLALTRKAWEKKGYMSIFCKKLLIPEQTPIKIQADYYGEWFYKNGKYKKVDGPNFDKMLYDVVCEKLGIDDSLIFKWEGSKIQSSDREGILVTVTILKGPHEEGRSGDIEKSSESNLDGPKKDYGCSWS